MYTQLPPMQAKYLRIDAFRLDIGGQGGGAVGGRVRHLVRGRLSLLSLVPDSCRRRPRLRPDAPDAPRSTPPADHSA